MNYTNVVHSFVLLLSLNLLMITLVESTTTQPETSTQFTKSRLLVGVRKTALSFGTLEILGELTGEKMDSSELSEALTILLLSQAATGVPLLTLGLKESNMLQHKRSRMILTMTRLFTTSHNQSTRLRIKTSCLKTHTKAAVLRNQVSQMVRFISLADHGTQFQLISFPKM
jgi:hypothetical protein